MKNDSRPQKEKEDNAEEKIRLRREFGLFQGVSVIVGFVVGTGIYIAPSGVLREVPSAGFALIIWVVAGIISTLGALTFAEIGTTIPLSGEKYAYLKVMFGDFMAFLQLWQFFLFEAPATNTIKCWVFAAYIMKPVFPDCDVPILVIILISICFMGIIIYANCLTVRLSARAQTFFSSMTLMTLAFIIIVTAVFLGKGNTLYLEPGYAMSSSEPITVSGVVFGLNYAMFSFAGWSALNFIVEELKDPYKNLPRAIVISMAVITTLYVLVNMGYLAALGVEGMVASEAVVVSFGNVTLQKGVVWMLIAVITFTSFGTLNSGILISSRFTYVGARNGHLPKIFSLIQIEKRSPIPALLIQYVIAMAMFAFDDIFLLLSQTVFISIFFNFITTIGMIKMRYTEPDRHRPLKVPLVIPILFLISQVFLMAIPLYSIPKKVGIGLFLTLVTGIPYYLIFVKRIIRITPLEKLAGKVLTLTQKAMMGVPEEQ